MKCSREWPALHSSVSWEDERHMTQWVLTGYEEKLFTTGTVKYWPEISFPAGLYSLLFWSFSNPDWFKTSVTYSNPTFESDVELKPFWDTFHLEIFQEISKSFAKHWMFYIPRIFQDVRSNECQKFCYKCHLSNTSWWFCSSCSCWLLVSVLSTSTEISMVTVRKRYNQWEKLVGLICQC